jgi:hypothetical protein
MGYLNKETVTVDAILTKKGRQLLAEGRSAFNITQFAVSDDEIDYGLYDPAHPLGTEYYGSAIENMPIVEASPDETQNLRYKLVSLDRSIVGAVNVIPTVSTQGITSVTLTFGTDTGVTIRPETRAGQNFTFDGSGFGYTAILYDSNAVTVTATPVVGATTVSTPVLANTISGNALVLQGTEFTISPNDVQTTTNTQLTIVGNQSGATVTLPITVNPATT